VSCSTIDLGSTEPSPNAAPEKITVGGSSETYEFLEDLSIAYQKETGVIFSFVPPTLSKGGIEGVKSGILDIGGVSRPLTSEEKTEILQFQSLVQNVPVLIVNNNLNLDNLTTAEIRGIYSGELTDWSQLGQAKGEIILVDLSEDESEKQVFREQYLGKDLKITPEAAVITDDQVLETIANTPNSIGLVPYEKEELEDLPIHVLRLDGVEPTRENILNGSYKMTQDMGIVFSTNPSPKVQKFVDFALSPEGYEILAEDYIILETKP
jgi:phosphate transport system substrate-binding protein